MRLGLATFCVIPLCVLAQSLPEVPDNLKPPAGEILAQKVRGEGAQVYTCDGSMWTLKAPDAKLFDESGKQVGTHFAGPTWEWSDGSRVVGQAAANATPDPDSIPWLLLRAKDHAGVGALSRITSIQRLSTQGGKAPASGCDASHKGQESRAHYTAIYCFYIRP
jgi:hypothetical protein